MRKGMVLVLVAVVSGLGFLAGHGWSAENGAVAAGRRVRPVAPRPVSPATIGFELVRILAAHRKVASQGPNLHGEGSLEPVDASVVTRHRLRDIVLESKEIDTLFGWEVPGKHIQVKVRVDVELQCWLEMNYLRVEVDPQFKDTFLVTLPAATKVVSTFPEDEWADYQVVYGAITFRQPGHAKEMRQRLYRAALDHAAKQTHHLGAMKEQMRSMVEGNLRSAFPNARIHVRWQER